MPGWPALPEPCAGMRQPSHNNIGGSAVCHQGQRATDLLGRTTLLVPPPGTWLLIWKGAECLLIRRCSSSWMSCIPKTVSLL